MSTVICGKKIRNKSFTFWFHRFFKFFTPRTRFIYLGEKITQPTILLANHAGITAPFGIELFGEFPMRAWGTYQMTRDLKSVRKYYSEIFLKQKHPNYSNFRCKLLGILLSPFAYWFYRGNQFIPTYPDARLIRTLKESEETLDKGMSIVIYPEDSSKGYFDILKLVLGGFAVLCERLYKNGRDMPVVFCYYHKKKHICVVGNAVKYSTLRGDNYDKNALSKIVLDGINSLSDEKFLKK